MFEIKVKTKLIIGVAVIVVAVGALIFNGVNSSAAFNLKVDEVLAKKTKYVGENVKMSGKIVGESVQYDADELLLTFQLRGEDTGKVRVTYEGPKPDTMNDDWEAIVTGTFKEDGTFAASELLVKCPSKYEAMEKNGEQQPAGDPAYGSPSERGQY